jgi:uncharacterized HhH-GPD family protein
MSFGKIQLGQFTETGPYSFRWPSGNVENFHRGWLGSVTVDGSHVEIRHALGRRDVYGRPRVHSVTWVNGSPSVEGVEVNDYERSRSLISVLRRPDKKHARAHSDIPEGYDGFTIVRQGDEIDAPYSPRDSLGVKIVDDNVAAWTVHAIIRADSYGRTRHARATLRPGPVATPTHTALVPTNKTAIVAAILAYARERPNKPASAPSFTPDPLANAFILENPFAFLTAVIMDQGVPAERAWQAPYELRKRLGHLDPARLASDGDEVAAAINRPPKLHRYVDKIPKWIVDAARRVASRYGGDASRIWNDKPTAVELQKRLDAFTGIGQKKAAMAVEILERDLGVEIRELQGSDVAYDVHLRRVFLRTTLANRDDPGHMISIARALHPKRPGELDVSVWRIGRQWCRAGTPDCGACVLTAVCPKEVYRAAGVTGG